LKVKSGGSLKKSEKKGGVLEMEPPEALIPKI
jgi:hypothetical protein